MKRSKDRILTTHVGTLARPEHLIPFLRQKERAQPYDAVEFASLVRAAVAEAVQKQVGSGIDIVRVMLSTTEGSSSVIQDEITRYLDFLATVQRNAQGEVSNGSSRDFTFSFGSSTTLTLQMIGPPNRPPNPRVANP